MIRTFLPSPPTVGVELEWQLVDRSSLDLRDGILPLADLLPDEPLVKPELIQAAVETITPPCASTAALRPGLRALLGRLVDAAASFDMALIGAGTHPFCERLIPITPTPRYLAEERSVGYLAHAHVAYALQTHVGMPSGDVAVRVARDLRGFLPILLALSASSPFFHDYETPFASYRQRVLAASRSTGIPPRFEDWQAFLHFLDMVERANMFASYRDMHWDLRVRPDFGTIEVRIMDAQPTLEASLALAAVVHSLLVRLASSDDLTPPVPPLPWWIEKENAFRASRDGLNAQLIRDANGTVEPIRPLAEALFDFIAPTARALGEEDDLARARAIVESGPSHEGQRAIFAQTGSTRAVVRALANELLDELERPRLEGEP